MTPPRIRERHEKLNAAWEGGRLAHFGSVEGEYRLIRESCAWLDVSSLGKLRFTGEDRKGWLQGQVTNDLRNFEDGSFIRYCVLSPTGQIVADCEMWAAGEEYVVTLADNRLEATLARLKKMLILEDVQIEDLTGGFGMVSVQGPQSSEVLEELIDLPRLNAGKNEGVYYLRSDRTGSGGWDICFPQTFESEIVALLTNIPPAGEDALEIARIESGIPVFGKDIQDNTLAMEMGERFIESRISFSKGCYTGQEIVERIRSRGHANRKWVGLLLEKPARAGDALAGRGLVTSAAVSPEFGPIAAAFVRAEHTSRQTTVETADGVIGAEIVEMPIRF